MEEKYPNIELLFEQIIHICFRLAEHEELKNIDLDNYLDIMYKRNVDTTIFATEKLIVEIEEFINYCHFKCGLQNYFKEDFEIFNKKTFKQSFFENKVTIYITEYLSWKKDNNCYLKNLFQCLALSFPWLRSKGEFTNYSKVCTYFKKQMDNLFIQVFNKKMAN